MQKKKSKKTIDRKVVLSRLKSILTLEFLRKSPALKKFFRRVGRWFRNLPAGARKLFSRLRKFNVYRRFREMIVFRYLKQVVSLPDNRLVISWQPLLWVLIKLAVVGYLGYRIYLLYPLLAGWFEQGLAFFRLDEIYNFDFPDKAFFRKIARYLLLALLGYYGLSFVYQQLRALFSSISIHKGEQKIYYIDHALFKKQVYIFSIPELDVIVLGQNLFFRLFKMGSISLYKRTGEKFVIPALRNASHLTRLVTEMKRTHEPGISSH